MRSSATFGFLTAALVGAMLYLPGCSGTSKPSNLRGPFEVTLVSTGLGQVYPYRIRRLDPLGNPTATIISITSREELRENITANNGVLPVASFPETAILPNGLPGNQFLMVRFNHPLDPTTILSDLPVNQAQSGLTGALSVVAYDPVTETVLTVPGRGFVGGKTFLDDPATPGLDLQLVQAVEKSGSTTEIVDSRVDGFPRGFPGDQELVEENVFVFVPDTDGDLRTFETFPTGSIIRVQVSNAVANRLGRRLNTEVATATTVGPDNFAPQVLGYSRAPAGPFEIVPGNNQTGVDPLTTILVRFSKPVQPRDVGDFFSLADKTPPLRGISIQVTAAAHTFGVTYYADPRTVGDMMNYVVTPAWSLPGQSVVEVRVNDTIRALTGVFLGSIVSTEFTTGDGAGIVNAPVAPETVYIGIGGSEPGLAVLDLNGFGQGTGVVERSNFPRNPNVGAPGVFPNLAPGTTTLDAGGEGALTLTRDSSGDFRLLKAPVVGEVGDIVIGQPLDMVFNNENINPEATRANQVNPYTASTIDSFGNNISSAPHPNPPRLVFPPPNPARAIFGEEPSVTSSGPPFVAGRVMTVHPPTGPCRPTPLNRLGVGNPFATNPGEVGLFDTQFQSVFYGPQPAPTSPQRPTPFCPFTSRQQIGHFLYVLDRGNRQVLVLNSNRFTVLDTIKLSDPVRMAMSPNLRVLAVTNFSSGTVAFIDTHPQSPNFHRVVGETRVGRGPSALAWQPEGEDLLVVNRGDNTLSILHGTDQSVRKTVSGGVLNDPIGVAVTPRQVGLGWNAGIYFAYILNANGTVAIFESGPDGVNGIGFDDVVGIPPEATFRRARTIQPNVESVNSAVWITHQDDGGLGQVSHLELTSTIPGPIPISPVQGGFIQPPTFRQREWTVTGRIGGSSPTTPVKDRLSGDAPVSIAFDNLLNFGALPDMRSVQMGNLTYAPHSGKGLMKIAGAGVLVPSYVPRLMFIALSDTGKLDIFELDTGVRVRTLDLPGISVVSHYWRQ